MVDLENSSHSVNILCDETLRNSFVSHLSIALRREGVSVYVFTDTVSDDQIQGARVSVVVFSEVHSFCYPWVQNFANGHEVIPVFYGVDPSSVKLPHELLTIMRESGISAGHQSRNSSNTIRRDSELVEDIVGDVYGRLYPTERIGIYSRLLKIENLLCEQPWDVRSLGIWGMPGIGKTTLAKAVFYHMSNDYDASCFIESFDEQLHKKGPHCLLDENLGTILKEKFGVSSSYMTSLSILGDKLCDTRILLVLDDVRNPLVAESFLGRLDWFGPGSLIIITSTYKQVFALCQISQIYEVQGLNKLEALQLFSQIAFEKYVPEENDKELSMKVIDYANGNPLALCIYGQELKGKKSEMEDAFLKLKQRPPKKIQGRLKSVYSTLGDNEKCIFLDIACFFKGENVDYVVQLLKGCGYFPRVGIDVLVEKCLVTISENTLHINDLIQDIFQEIVVGERIQMKRCTTLWQPSCIRYLLEDVELRADGKPTETPKCLLGAEDIEGISLDTSNLIFDVNYDAFKKMVSLRFLKVYNSYSENVPGLNFPKGLSSSPCELKLLHWENYPFESLPEGFDLRELVELNMPYSKLKDLWPRTKNFEMLKRIKLCHSLKLVNLSIHAQNIELINLQGCTRLKSFSAMKFQHLRVLNLSGCINITIFPELPPNIEELYLQGTSIEEIPISIVSRPSQPNCKELMNHIKNFPGLEHIALESVTNLIKVSSYNQGVGKLVRLNMKDCFHLRSLPDMFSLESLQVLELSGCSSLEEIKGFPRNMIELYLAGTGIQELPEFPGSLEFLNAHGCHLLKSARLDFEQLPRHYNFSNCFNLSFETTIDFLETGLTRVIRLVREQNQEHIKAPAFNICFPADVCLRSSFHWQVSSFAMVKLPCMRKAFSGFAMSVSVSFWDDCHNVVGLGIRCICTWRTRNAHSDNIERLERVFKCWAPAEAPRVEKGHIFVFYNAELYPRAGEEKDSNISEDEIKFEFHTVSGDNIPLGASCMVTECGVKVITAPTGDKTVNKTTRESETMSIIEDEDAPLLLREPKATGSVSKITREIKPMSTIDEESAPPLPREPEATSSLSKITREGEAMSIIEEEDAPPLPREPEATSSVSKTTRESETMSIIEEEDAPLLPRESEATSSLFSSSEPHKLSSKPSKVRSKRTVFWKWVGCFPMPPKNLKFRGRRTRVLEEALIESKEKGKGKQVADDQVDIKGQIKHSKEDWNRLLEKAIIESKELKGKGKQVADDQVDGKEQIKHAIDHVEKDLNSRISICHGCNSAIEDELSINAFGAVWHPQCLCCLHCQEPIAMHEIPHLNKMFHKPCYKESRNPNCCVCEKKIPLTVEGRKYIAHSFWGKKYCPSHESDGTPKCCSCERLEHWGTHYVMLADGRWLCRECMECVVMDTYEGQALDVDIREFFEGLNMKIEQEFPLLLVEKEVLNKAEKAEKIDYQYEDVIRGICLSEEQIVTIVSKRPRMGPNNQLIDMVIDPQMVVRKCEVTAILILYGLARPLAGYILAHEMMHAWLRLNGYRNLNTVLEEGLCQVLGHMWLESQTYGSSDSAATDFSFSPNTASTASFNTASNASTFNKGDESDFEKKLVEFCKHQIETDDSPVFGIGFKKVNQIMRSNNGNLRDTLKVIVSASKTT